MRSTLWAAILATMFVGAGCTYDRQLLGDPQQAEPAQPEVAAPSSAPQESMNEAAPYDSMNVGEFNELSYYGLWYRVDPYGWVWRPTVVLDWQPFLNGHWIWSQYGWMWVDYDPWGWATSHYGYWTTDFTLGWIWVPGYEWSPARCDWMMYGDYICWAPMPPPGHGWHEPWDDQTWVSVPVRKFKDTYVGGVRVSPKYKPETASTEVRGAPDRDAMERRGVKVATVNVQVDKKFIGGREFDKVKFPPDQQRIIDEQHVRVTPAGPPVAPPVASGIENGSPPPATVGPTQPSTPPSKGKSKSKDSGSSGKKTEKFKSEHPREKKDSGKSKDESKTGKKEGG